MRIQSEGMKETDKLETRRKLQFNTQSPDNAKVIGETNSLIKRVTRSPLEKDRRMIIGVTG